MPRRTSFGAKSRSAGRRGLFLVTLIAILIILTNIATGGKVSALTRDLVSPVSGFGARIGSAITQNGFFSTRHSLESEISVLQNELQQQQLQAAAFEALQQQNASLSQLEHLAATTKGLAAPVTSSVVSSPYGTFTIGAGSADGVSQSSLVLTADGFVVGTVVQVQAHQSLVDELLGPGIQTPVTIDGASVLATGQGGTAIAEVPHGITVSQNDPVVAPEYGGRPIGIVQHVDSNPANAQSAAYIALPVSLSSLQYVYVTL
jgi:cell shape-determining protein MreC